MITILFILPKEVCQLYLHGLENRGEEKLSRKLMLLEFRTWQRGKRMRRGLAPWTETSRASQTTGLQSLVEFSVPPSETWKLQFGGEISCLQTLRKRLACP